MNGGLVEEGERRKNSYDEYERLLDEYRTNNDMNNVKL